MFQFTLEYGGELEIDVRSFLASDAATEVRLLDEKGEEIAVGDNKETLAAEMSAGNYFLEVAAADRVSVGRYGIWMTMRGEVS